tara:strand:+ start:146 stop:751 length:606 start_codon:yes stop_codon:yes gene_type:complete
MTNNQNFLSQIETHPEQTLLLEKNYEKFIKKEGIYEPEWITESFSEYKSFKPLRYLIENNLVVKDDDGDWILVQYSFGTTNTEEFFHWEKTGYQRVWSIFKWKSDTDLDENHTYYSIETKDGWNRKYLKILLNNHGYSKHIHPNGFWVETVNRTGRDDGYGENQLYYKDSLGNTSGKMPVKIGKKVQEIKDKGIEFGFYKF